MKAFRPIWLAFRAAVLATAVFAVATYIVDRIGWQPPLGLTADPFIFFAVFFLGVLMVGRS